jgi:hypothetical protein
MAADASARGTTFEPRGPSLSIGTVGLFVNRIAQSCDGSEVSEAVKNGRQTPRALAPACRPRRTDPTIHSKILYLQNIDPRTQQPRQSRTTARAGLPRRPALAGYPARYARTALTIASASFWR